VLGPALVLAVVYVGVDNLLRAPTSRPWALALPFGLVHGFALALLPALPLDLRAPSSLTAFALGAGLVELALAALLVALVPALRARFGRVTAR
jgi:hypothetical protein